MRRRNELAILMRLEQAKRLPPRAVPPLGDEMVRFFRHTVRQKHTKLAKIAQCWVNLIPEAMNEHCALHGLHRGTLTVLVDSSPHLFELKQLLLAGLQEQLFLVCSASGLRKVALKPGTPESFRDRRCTGR